MGASENRELSGCGKSSALAFHEIQDIAQADGIGIENWKASRDSIERAVRAANHLGAFAGRATRRAAMARASTLVVVQIYEGVGARSGQ